MDHSRAPVLDALADLRNPTMNGLADRRLSGGYLGEAADPKVESLRVVRSTSA